MSVLRIDKLTGSSEDVIDLDVEWGPSDIEVDYKRGKVYVTNYGSDKLSVIDIIEIIKGNEAGAVSTINNVGDSMTAVVADPSFDRLYLLNDFPGEVIIVRPFKEGLESFMTVMPPVLGTVPVGDSPVSMILDSEARKLYVVNRDSNTVSVVDKTAKKEELTISTGKRPYGIAMLKRAVLAGR